MMSKGATWRPCECGNYWCAFHDCHVHDCACPPVEEWATSPYASAIKRDGYREEYNFSTGRYETRYFYGDDDR